MDSDSVGAKEVFICGGGHQGLSMAAHLSICGLNVRLWNRTPAHIAEVKKTGDVCCSGIINGIGHLKKVSSNISDVISDFIMVTTPSNAHKEIAKMLAPFVNKNMVIILNPGRTFGAIEFAHTLKECGVSELPHIAETQTIIYTCRKYSENCAQIFALKNDVEIESIGKNDLEYIISRIPMCIRKYFKPVKSTVITSLSNVGMILHFAPVLMNIGWIENKKTAFKYYYDGITPSIASFLEKMDHEKISVAKALGYEIETTETWLKRTYNVDGHGLYECLKNTKQYRAIDAPETIHHRYIIEDVPCGLVPVEDAAIQCGVSTKNITSIIDLASAVTEIDFRSMGRKFIPEFVYG